MKRILVIKLSALGDICVFLPHLEAILAHHAGEEVWMLTSPAYAGLFCHHPRVRLAILDRRQWLGPNGTLRLFFWLRRQRFDTIYDFQANRICRSLVRYSGTPRRAGFQPHPFYEYHPPTFYTRDTPQNIFDRLQEIIHAAGLPPAKPSAAVYPGPADIVRVAAWKRERGLVDGSYVLLHPGAAAKWPSKKWPAEYFLALAGRLTGLGLRVIWVGGPDDAAITPGLAARVGIDAANVFSLSELYLLAGSARLGIANDSGPMHLMAVAGIPVFGLFGPTSWLRSHALGQRERVLYRRLPCSPCYEKKCPSGEHSCLKGIPPEEVLERIDAEGLLPARDQDVSALHGGRVSA